MHGHRRADDGDNWDRAQQKAKNRLGGGGRRGVHGRSADSKGRENESAAEINKINETINKPLPWIGDGSGGGDGGCDRGGGGGGSGGCGGRRRGTLGTRRVCHCPLSLLLLIVMILLFCLAVCRPRK